MSADTDQTTSGAASTATAPPPPPEPPAATAASAPHDSGGGGRTWLGLILILAGVLFLAARFFPLVAFVNLWPLIIIVAGLVGAFTPGKEGWSVAKMFDGFVTVAFGGVFLAITLGYVGWGVWVRILSFWPVLLISVGFDLLARAMHTTWLKVVGSLVVIAALTYAVVTYAGGTGAVDWITSAGPGEPVDISEPVAGVTEAQLTIDGGVAQIDVGSGGDLIGISGTSPWGQPTVEVDRSGSMASVAADLGDGDSSFVWPDDASANLDITLSDEVLWDVRMNTGVASVRADLSDVPIRGFDLRPGVAECDVRLGEVPEGVDRGNVQVRSGVSSVVLRVPADAQGRVQIESGLSSTNVRGGFEKAGTGVWETAGYDEALADDEPVWLIVVRSGVGAITIDTY